MPVPVFTADGLLPPGRHVATVVDVEQALVEPFPESTRRSLFASWRARRDALLALLPVVEWVDGSFVGAKPVPADIDLVTILSVEDHDGLTVTDRDACTAWWTMRTAERSSAATSTPWSRSPTAIRTMPGRWRCETAGRTGGVMTATAAPRGYLEVR